MHCGVTKVEIAICEATSCRREALTVAVVALDGDVLVPVDSRKGIPGQLETIANVAGHLGALVKNGHRLVITHGNASQVGYMLLRGEVARHVIHSLPLDICGADTQGATGYMLQQALCNWFSRHGLDQEVTTLVTQVVVGEPAPPGAPCTKGIGPFFDWERAQALINNHKWEFDMVPGHGYQRIVPCLTPKKIVEARSIRNLFDNGAVVICAGGGASRCVPCPPLPPPFQGGQRGVWLVLRRS
jgi:carbamate kinase